MTAKVVFFIFPVLLVLLPVLIYNRYSPLVVRICLHMITDPESKRVPANILVVLLVFYITIHYAVYPKDWGIIPPIAIIIFLSFTKNCIKTLLTIRRKHYLRWCITFVCLIIPFIPHLLSLAITLAFILEFSYFYPSDGMEKFYDDHANEADVDKKFIDAYFK